MSTNEDLFSDDAIPVASDEFTEVMDQHHSTVEPVKFSGIGPDGVAHILPLEEGGTCVYQDLTKDSFNTQNTNISMGHDSHFPSTKKTENGITFHTTESVPLNYASDHSTGFTTRIDFVSDGDIWDDEKNAKAWHDTPIPEYLFSPKGWGNSEFTIYIRTHGQHNNKHQSCAAKMMGRRGIVKKDDEDRSVVEMLYPEVQHKKVTVNCNYNHQPYEHFKAVKQYFDGDMLEDEKWVGLKWTNVIADDRKSLNMKEYVDLEPFTSEGKPANNWKLKAECDFTGTPGYHNIPAVWKGRLNYLRVDGRKTVDFTLGSCVASNPKG